MDTGGIRDTLDTHLIIVYDKTQEWEYRMCPLKCCLSIIIIILWGSCRSGTACRVAGLGTNERPWLYFPLWVPGVNHPASQSQSCFTFKHNISLWQHPFTPYSIPSLHACKILIMQSSLSYCMKHHTACSIIILHAALSYCMQHAAYLPACGSIRPSPRKR